LVRALHQNCEVTGPDFFRPLKGIAKIASITARIIAYLAFVIAHLRDKKLDVLGTSPSWEQL